MVRDLRVLDCSTNVAGAYAARLFAIAGADVVKLEAPQGDPLRHAPPLVHAPIDGAAPRSAAHAYLHAYKRGVALDLEVESGRAVLDRLAEQTDLVISNFDGDPGAALSRDARLRAANPHIVHVVTSGFGLTGPYRAFHACEFTEWAAGGHFYITGDPDREPLQAGGPWAGYATGLTAAIGGLAALFHRKQTGHGDLVDVGAMEALAATHQWSLTLFTHQGVIKRRGGNRHVESYHPMGFQAVKDGWVCIGAASQAQYEAFCIAVDQPELIDDPRFVTGGHRLDRADEFDALIAPWLRARTREEVVARLQEFRVPASRVLALDELLVDPQLESRAYWVTPEGFGIHARMPGVPFRIGEPVPYRGAPGLGEHTIEVLTEAGYTSDEIDRLVAAGVAVVEGRASAPRGAPA